jgi:hypothetical protein
MAVPGRTSLTTGERQRLHEALVRYGVKRVSKDAKVGAITLLPAVDGLPVTMESARRLRIYLDHLNATGDHG